MDRHIQWFVRWLRLIKNRYNGRVVVVMMVVVVLMMMICIVVVLSEIFVICVNKWSVCVFVCIFFWCVFVCECLCVIFLLLKSKPIHLASRHRFRTGGIWRDERVTIHTTNF